MSRALSDDQQLMWEVLSQNPSQYVHRWGPVLAGLDNDKLEAQLNDIMPDILKFPVEDACCIMKTLLCTYQIALGSPCQFDSWDLFHNRCHKYILEIGGKIRLL